MVPTGIWRPRGKDLLPVVGWFGLVWCSTRFSTARFASHSETLVRRTQQCTMRFRLAPASGAATKPHPKDKLDHSPTGMRTPPIWMYVVDYNALSVVVWWVVMDAPHIPGPVQRLEWCHNELKYSAAMWYEYCIQNWFQAQFCAISVALCTMSSEAWMMP